MESDVWDNLWCTRVRNGICDTVHNLEYRAFVYAYSAKSEFLSHMSHDLRTPINGILGMLTIMEKSQDDLEKQRECREKIRVSTEHLLSLVNDVLEVSKLESGRPAIAEEPFDLHDALEECITVLSPQAALCLSGQKSWLVSGINLITDNGSVLCINLSVVLENGWIVRVTRNYMP